MLMEELERLLAVDRVWANKPLNLATVADSQTCGVKIPHGRGLQGHSDADVGMHAVTDAIYGALAQGDIGQHFPPSDPQWKGAASEIFLKHAVALATEMGFRVSNIDCTLVSCADNCRL